MVEILKSLELPRYYSITNEISTSETYNITPSTADIIQAHHPASAIIWHDVLAFNRHWGVPTFERYDGATWASATLDSRIFAHLENQAIQIIDGTTHTAARWTWTGANVFASYAYNWIIAFTYQSPVGTKDILIESSTDGTTWTTRHSSTGNAANAQPVFLRAAEWGGDNQVRLTITMTNSRPLLISSMRALSARWGNQGGGSELAVPYVWDASRNITLAGWLELPSSIWSIKAGGLDRMYFTVGSGATYIKGSEIVLRDAADGTRFRFNTDTMTIGTAGDTNLYRAGADTLKTDDALYAAGNILAQQGGAAVVAAGARGPAAQAGIQFGSALDTNLYRSAANRLQTDDELGVKGGVFSDRVATTDYAYRTWVTGNAQPRHQVRTDGLTEWSDGTATADTNLYRSAANELATDDTLRAVGGVGIGPTAGQFNGLATGIALGGGTDPSANPSGGFEHYLWTRLGGLRARSSTDSTYPLGPIRVFEQALTANYTFTTTLTAWASTQRTVTTRQDNALVLVAAAFDIEQTATFATTAGYCFFDGVAGSGVAAHKANAVGERHTVTQVWAGTFASAGSHTIELGGFRSGGGSIAYATNTKYVAIVIG